LRKYGLGPARQSSTSAAAAVRVQRTTASMLSLTSAFSAAGS